MNTVIVLSRQTIIDIALQEYGTAEAAFDLAAANDYSISDSAYLVPGEALVLPELEVNKEVLDYYKENNINPKSL